MNGPSSIYGGWPSDCATGNGIAGVVDEVVRALIQWILEQWPCSPTFIEGKPKLYEVQLLCENAGKKAVMGYHSAHGWATCMERPMERSN